MDGKPKQRQNTGPSLNANSWSFTNCTNVRRFKCPGNWLGYFRYIYSNTTYTGGDHMLPFLKDEIVSMGVDTGIQRWADIDFFCRPYTRLTQLD